MERHKTNPKKSILGLEYPVIGLAPMDGITDSPFRQITKKYGNPDIIFTEFTHVMGLCIAGQNTIHHFHFEEMERPVVAQIYGQEPNYFYHAAKIVIAMGFDGVDINMGCPAKKVTARGSGAALIRTPDLAQEIIYEVKRGVDDWVRDGKLTGLKPKAKKAIEAKVNSFRERAQSLANNGPQHIAEQFSSSSNIHTSHSISTGFHNLLHPNDRKSIPTSVKTRIGFDEPVTESWVKKLHKANPEWISIHGRTLKQMYSGGANWNELKKAVESTDIPIMTNGDIKEYNDIEKMLHETGAFGVLIGRATFGNPWIFQKPAEITRKQRLDTLVEHAHTFNTLHSESERSFLQMRKHFGWYCRNFADAKELRSLLVRVKSMEELVEKFPTLHDT